MKCDNLKQNVDILALFTHCSHSWVITNVRAMKSIFRQLFFNDMIYHGKKLELPNYSIHWVIDEERFWIILYFLEFPQKWSIYRRNLYFSRISVYFIGKTRTSDFQKRVTFYCEVYKSFYWYHELHKTPYYYYKNIFSNISYCFRDIPSATLAPLKQRYFSFR